MTLQDDIALMKDKVAVITGAAKGIGFAVATALVERGAKVVIGDVLREEGAAAVKALNEKAKADVAVFQFCDVRHYADNKQLFQLAESRFGGVDIAILNAGVSTNANALTVPLEDEAEALIHDINLIGVIKGAKVAIMHMIKRGGGCIINTASIAGVLGGPGLSAYSATKHGVMGFTRSMDDLQGLDIRVNAVCPYWVDTDIIKLKDENGDPLPNEPILKAFPKVPMELVVDTYLNFIRDDGLAGEAYMVLPDGAHELERFVLPEVCMNEEALVAIAEHSPKIAELNLQKLKDASKAYFSQNSKL
ncbi:hypothetical protein BC940DRAFT_329221 [Gongronella butleri]|nr:hypothetical protein BC940DRAFT_329221 [Gongronella butleri]